MESNYFYDLFSTKGIEYVLVIMFLISFVMFFRYLEKPARLTARVSIPVAIESTLINWFQILENYFYHPGHCWVKVESGNVVSIGIDDFASKLLGTPNKINLPRLGENIAQGEMGMSMEIDGKRIDLLTPVNGEVVEINQDAVDNPDLFSRRTDESDSWLFKVRVPKLKANLVNLLSGDLAKAWMEEVSHKLSRLTTGDLGFALQDGGQLKDGFSKEISPENWDELAKEFLLTK